MPTKVILDVDTGRTTLIDILGGMAAAR